MPDYSYQEDGIRFLRNARRAILGDEPGLGKSRQALIAAEGRTLLVAPAAVLDAGVWQTEIEKWNPDLDVMVSSYHGLANRVSIPATSTKRATTQMKPVLNQAIKDAHKDRPFQTVIFDEAHYLKERDTIWTKAVKPLITSYAKGSNPPENVFLLSGTPMPNWAYEIYVPLTYCRPDDLRDKGYLSSYWRWIQQYFRTSPSAYGGPYSLDIEGLIGCTDFCKGQCVHWQRFHEEAFTYQGKKIFLQRLRDDVLTDLPPMTEQYLHMPMDTLQAKHYKDLKKDFVIWLQDQDDATFTVEAWNTAAHFVKLMKAASGIDVASYPDRPKGKTLSNKLDALEVAVRDQAQPCLVAAHFKATVFLAAERLSDMGKRVLVLTGQTTPPNRKKIVDAFQAGDADCLIATIDVIKEGLTLTAADTCHMLERSWRPSSNTQVIRRIHRIGQTRPVTVYWYVSKGTHEANQLRTLKEKTDQQVKALTKPELLRILTED